FLYSGNWASVRYRCIRLKQDNIFISRDSTQNKYFRLKSGYPSWWKVNNCNYLPADQRFRLITFSNLCGRALHSERSRVDIEFYRRLSCLRNGCRFHYRANTDIQLHKSFQFCHAYSTSFQSLTMIPYRAVACSYSFGKYT